jgi:hypothetical protein
MNPKPAEKNRPRDQETDRDRVWFLTIAESERRCRPCVDLTPSQIDYVSAPQPEKKALVVPH